MGADGPLHELDAGVRSAAAAVRGGDGHAAGADQARALAP